MRIRACACVAFMAAIVLFFTSCSGGKTAASTSSSSSSSSSAISISLIAATSFVSPGGSDQLTAIVTGTTGTSVTYTVSPSSAGSVSLAGLFTASSSITTNMTVTITAISVADPSKTASVNIAIDATPAGVAIKLAAASSTVASGGSDQLTATVTGTTNTSVSYTVTPKTAGTVSSTGVFLASSVTANTVVAITATSAADPTRTASVVLTIVPPQGVQVTLSAASPTVASGGMDALTATVSGSSNQTVTFSISPASAGSIAGGVFSAATVASDTSVTITAAAVADATRTASVTLTVTAYQLNSVAYSPVLFCNNPLTCAPQTLRVMGSGFLPSDTFTTSPALSSLSSVAFVSAGEIDVTLRFDQGTAFGSHALAICRAGSSGLCTNTIPLAVLTGRNLMARDATSGELFLLEPGNTTTAVHLYNSLGAHMGDLQPIAAPTAIALDNLTNLLVLGSTTANGLAVVTESGASAGGGSGNGLPVLAVDARNGYACGTQPGNSSLLCADLVNDPYMSSPTVILTDADPCAVLVTTAQNGTQTETDAVVFSCTAKTLKRYSLPGGTLKATKTISGITPGSSLNTGVQLAALDASKVGVLSPADQMFWLYNLQTASLTEQVPLTGSFPERLVADPVGGMFFLESAMNAGATPLSLERLNPATGIISVLNSSFPANVPAGSAVSLDDSEVFVGEGATVVARPNN